MHKYLGNLFSKIFSIYSNLNPKHKNNAIHCCIITIINCNFNGQYRLTHLNVIILKNCKYQAA